MRNHMAPKMKITFLVTLFSLIGLSSFSQEITRQDSGIESFVDEEYFIRIFSKEDLVSYEIWDLTRDKRRFSYVINAPKGSKVTNYIIINPTRLKEGDYMIKLIRQNDVKKIWFNLPKFKDRTK